MWRKSTVILRVTTRSGRPPLVEKKRNGNFQASRLESDGAARSLRRARGGGLYVVAFRSRGDDPRHRARLLARLEYDQLMIAVQHLRAYEPSDSCTDDRDPHACPKT